MIELNFYTQLIIPTLVQLLQKRGSVYDFSRREPINLIVNDSRYTVSGPGWRIEVEKDNKAIIKLMADINRQLLHHGATEEPKSVEFYPYGKVLVSGSDWTLTFAVYCAPDCKNPQEPACWEFIKQEQPTYIHQLYPEWRDKFIV